MWQQFYLLLGLSAVECFWSCLGFCWAEWLTESADSPTKENLWHRIVPRVAGWLDFEVDSVSRYCSGLTVQGESDLTPPWEVQAGSHFLGKARDLGGIGRVCRTQEPEKGQEPLPRVPALGATTPTCHTRSSQTS